MKTLFQLAAAIVLMVVMYVYFIAICLYALIALPFIKLNEFVKNITEVNQLVRA